MMAGPFLGGHAITAITWDLGPMGMLVRFETTYADMCHQVYVGRSLVGWTDSVDELLVLCNVVPSDWPEHVQMLAVDPDDRATDFGSLLPPRPYNRAKLGWTTSGWASDTRFSEITAGTAPGEAVDTNNVIGLELFDTDRAYNFITDPLEGSGEWNFEVAGRDQTRPDGNRGTALSLTADILAHPPDVDFADDGYNRFTLSVAGGTLTVSFVEPE